MLDMIYLDMDGVLVDFIGRVFADHGRPPEECDRWNLWELFPDRYGSKDEFYQDYFNRLDAQWWASLEPYPWAGELFDFCRRLAPVQIATSPGKYAACYEGKLAWLDRFYADLPSRERPKTIFIADKFRLANRECVLVDDCDKNVLQFVRQGGATVLFPQRWNANASKTTCRLSWACYEMGRVVANLAELPEPSWPSWPTAITRS